MIIYLLSVNSSNCEICFCDTPSYTHKTDGQGRFMDICSSNSQSDVVLILMTLLMNLYLLKQEKLH
jgi:GTPase Era involved in 16S rRNA processing